MDRLLTQEREEGWDWEKGIKEQYEVRERQAAISEKIIAESNKDTPSDNMFAVYSGIFWANLKKGLSALRN